MRAGKLAFTKADALTHQLANFSDTLDFGFNAEPIADFAINASADFTADIMVEFDFGVDLGDLYGGASFADSFFLRDASVSANSTINAPDINANARLSFFTNLIKKSHPAGAHPI